jgi:hypothetical protein
MLCVSYLRVCVSVHARKHDEGSHTFIVFPHKPSTSVYTNTSHINDESITDMSVIDTVKSLFETCTNDLQNPNVLEIMNTFKRKGLSLINSYTQRLPGNPVIFAQLEPVMRRAKSSIEDLVKQNLVTANDTDVVQAQQRITNMYTLCLNEVLRIQPPTQQQEVSTLLMKLKNCM